MEGSENIELERKKDDINKEKRDVIEPCKIFDEKVVEHTHSLLKVKLKEGWKLKFRFEFQLANPPRSSQIKFLASAEEKK